MEIFNYDEAFKRNIGWVTQAEQKILRHKRVAIAGMGGVGGLHLLTLARLGIGAFNISDMDKFEQANFNRQFGATMSSLHKEKVKVLADMAHDINPEAEINIFPEGVNNNNIEEFMKDVDMFVDGFDFFAIEPRQAVFEYCHKKGIPAITAAPAGMGCAYVIFMPGGMSFEDYFQMKGLSYEKKLANFFIGLTPKGLHRHYLVDRSTLNFEAKTAPSVTMGCELSAAIVGVEVAKILLKRGKIKAAPYYHIFDAYLQKFYTGKLRWGNRGFMQRIKHKMLLSGLKKNVSAFPKQS